MWERIFGCSDSSTSNSTWNAFLVRFNSAYARLGRLISMIAGEACLCGFKSPALRNSLFYRIFFSHGTNRLIVVIFALYLPIDYALRTWSPVQLLRLCGMRRFWSSVLHMCTRRRFSARDSGCTLNTLRFTICCFRHWVYAALRGVTVSWHCHSRT